MVRDRAADSGTGTLDLSALDGAETAARRRPPARGRLREHHARSPPACGSWTTCCATQASTPPAAPRRTASSTPRCTAAWRRTSGSTATTYANSLTYRRDRAPWEIAAFPGSRPYTVRWDPRTRTTVPGRGAVRRSSGWTAPRSGVGGNRFNQPGASRRTTASTTSTSGSTSNEDQMHIGATGTTAASRATPRCASSSRPMPLRRHWTGNGRTPSARLLHRPAPRSDTVLRRPTWASSRPAGYPAQLHRAGRRRCRSRRCRSRTRDTLMTPDDGVHPGWTRARSSITSPPSSRHPAHPGLRVGRDHRRRQGRAGHGRVRRATACSAGATTPASPRPATPVINRDQAREIASLRVSEAIDTSATSSTSPTQLYTAGTHDHRFTDTDGCAPSARSQTLTFTYDYDVSEYDSPPPVVYADHRPSQHQPRPVLPEPQRLSSACTARSSPPPNATADPAHHLPQPLQQHLLHRHHRAVRRPCRSGRKPRIRQPARLSTRRYDQTSRARYGAQVYQVPATPWIQTLGTAGRIADYLLSVAASTASGAR